MESHELKSLNRMTNECYLEITDITFILNNLELDKLSEKNISVIVVNFDKDIDKEIHHFFYNSGKKKWIQEIFNEDDINIDLVKNLVSFPSVEVVEKKYENLFCLAYYKQIFYPMVYDIIDPKKLTKKEYKPLDEEDFLENFQEMEKNLTPAPDRGIDNLNDMLKDRLEEYKKDLVKYNLDIFNSETNIINEQNEQKLSKSQFFFLQERLDMQRYINNINRIKYTQFLIHTDKYVECESPINEGADVFKKFILDKIKSLLKTKQNYTRNKLLNAEKDYAKYAKELVKLNNIWQRKGSEWLEKEERLAMMRINAIEEAKRKLTDEKTNIIEEYAARIDTIEEKDANHKIKHKNKKIALKKDEDDKWRKEIRPSIETQLKTYKKKLDKLQEGKEENQKLKEKIQKVQKEKNENKKKLVELENEKKKTRRK